VPLTVRTKSDDVYDMLSLLLRAGELPLKEALSTPELATQLIVSRTPVRQALKRLHDEGHLLYTRGYGYYLPLPSIADIQQAYPQRLRIFEVSLQKSSNGRRRRRPKQSRAEAATQILELSSRSGTDIPARLIEMMLRDLAQFSPNPQSPSEAEANIAFLAPFRRTEQLIAGHAIEIDRIVRLYVDGKFDELLYALGEYSAKRRKNAAMLLKQVGKRFPA
jgi:biotin operon repressor